MRKLISVGVFCCAAVFSTAASAWLDEGHMQVAAVAYDRLTPAARAKVDALIRLNPQYPNWSAGWPADKKGQYAFVRAATWADDIKQPEYGHIDTKHGDMPNNPGAGRNIGYYDNLQHQYWHYKDIRFSTDGTMPDNPEDPVNAGTQIKLLSAGLAPSSGLPDDVRSYDLVWLIHLVGDAHQPLHAATRLSRAHHDGDQGGNLVSVVPATGETIALHLYWDRLLGGSSTPAGAIMDAFNYNKLPEPDAAAATDINPDDWFSESEKLAERFAYAAPVTADGHAAMLDRAYETNARDTARKQVALAGARLANLLNDILK